MRVECIVTVVFKYLVLALLIFAMMGCAPRQVGVKASSTQGLDPYQPFNRAMYKFNTKVTKVFLEPTVNLYTTAVPKPLRNGVGNFFANIATVPAILNDFLQFNFAFAVNDTLRLLLNSTLGMAGLVDVASYAGFNAHPQSFGLTLARWGVVRSPYLVLPFFGPSTIRDAVGMVPDYYTSPITYVKPWQSRWGLRGLDLIDTAAGVIPQQKLISMMALDPYVAERNAYLQNRAHIVKMIRGKGSVPDHHSLKSSKNNISRYPLITPVREERLGYSLNK